MIKYNAKILRLCFFKNFIKKLIASRLKIRDVLSPVKCIASELLFRLRKLSFDNVIINAPKIAIEPSRKENLAALVRSNLPINPVAIVEPDLETPGMIAIA